MFRGELVFLSNMFSSPIKLRTASGTLEFSSVENAYQASKTTDHLERIEFQTLTPGQAKRRGRTVALRSDWNEIKIEVMRRLISAKFSQNPSLAQRLLATPDELLVEDNNWGDKFWGVCDGEGQNWLGRILSEEKQKLLTRS